MGGSLYGGGSQPSKKERTGQIRFKDTIDNLAMVNIQVKKVHFLLYFLGTISAHVPKKSEAK